MSSISQPRRSNRKLVFSKGYETKKASGTVFSEEDDISLLKAMIDYEVTKHANPYDDMGKFLDFVKPFLSFDLQRRQLTNKLWGLKNRYINSDYDDGTLKPHHAKLFELSKLIKCWGQHANVSLDSDNVVSGDNDKSEDDMNCDSPNVQGVNVVGANVEVDKSSKVVESKGKGNVVTREIQNVKQGNVVIDDDNFVNKCQKLGKKKRKCLSRDGQNDKEANVVLGDVDGGKCSEVKHKKEEVVENKGKGKVVETKEIGKGLTCEIQSDEQHNEALDDDRKLGKKKRKRLSRDGQSDKEANVVLGDVDGGKWSEVVKHRKGKVVKEKLVENKGKGKVVETKGKGKVVTCEIQSVKQHNAALEDDTFLIECRKLGKKKRKHLSRDGQNDKEANVVLDNVDGGKCSEVIKHKKGKVVENKGKGKVVENKGTGKVVTCNSQNAEQDNVANDVVDVPNECLNADGDNCENVANSHGQDVLGDNVVVGDVEVDKTSKVAENKGKGKIVKNKGKGNVMTCGGENQKEDAKVIGNENVCKELNRKDLNDSTSMYPELARALELDTLSGMPKKCIMDIISSLGRKKASELEEKWADFRLMEMQLNAKKLDLSNRQIKLVLEAKRK